MLYTLSHSPWQVDIHALLRLVRPGDDILLMQDGVVAAVKDNGHLATLLASPARVVALQNDVEARGLTAQISSSIDTISYTEFVKLTVKHASQMAW
ncbi:sulfurtransferase complex subunit TusB [Cronobacter malonaticus]|uniref:Protein TusB n=1 Tax=Cronobacter malonaticus TaxID=413503 RepID=V5TVJ1_9ENTR|nr:sulfurtransferase complex subunit TusB [Cronobacter malonaticus]CCJ94412.1 tRNA 5-methylaminomethyl-2-thiouridine synthase TusB [Cronobacter malonaticus 681]CCJ99813.1 tRNA 5-methylaminomethyl-2-thiouridine synthase TusB [Cronobacter malonaticus 507]AHB68700.1 sulfur transfer complex subunit TusB [Cronobacter malonaticus]ALX76985.1 tRNA 2-thiouridine(34) synthase TusB [Cronobacter malonaticus LMG 23826]EGT4281944.1 sulfurtransferase complex subunit TusB [Cronobacter malonaticus]